MPTKLLRFENKKEPLLPRNKWVQRLINTAWLATGVIAGSLTIGVTGYHFISGLPWIDALLESSMILGGMGAVAPMTTDAAKLFASFYALMSGLIIMSTTGLLLAPFLHRMMHRFHADPDNQN
ncbi:MAG: hypothetical protein SFW65_01575 [Alphaproteobacteria bacterium]|nr:hypothetical protein [Alphaproteobacteria bacterium]